MEPRATSDSLIVKAINEIRKYERFLNADKISEDEFVGFVAHTFVGVGEPHWGPVIQGLPGALHNTLVQVFRDRSASERIVFADEMLPIGSSIERIRSRQVEVDGLIKRLRSTLLGLENRRKQQK